MLSCGGRNTAPIHHNSVVKICLCSLTTVSFPEVLYENFYMYKGDCLGLINQNFMSDPEKSTFQLQPHFNDSNIFGTMGICSKYG